MFLSKDINCIRKISYFSSMKNIFFLCLLFCLTILGCDKEKSGTPKSGNGYFMYSITINGVTHKIEGNLNQNGGDALSGNYCLASYAGIAGAFDFIRGIGEFLLQKQFQTPFLIGSSYMYSDYDAMKFAL